MEEQRKIIRLHFSEVPSEVIASDTDLPDEDNMIFLETVDYSDRSAVVDKILGHFISLTGIRNSVVILSGNGESSQAKPVVELLNNILNKENNNGILLDEKTLKAINKYIAK